MAFVASFKRLSHCDILDKTRDRPESQKHGDNKAVVIITSLSKLIPFKKGKNHIQYFCMSKQKEGLNEWWGDYETRANWPHRAVQNSVYTWYEIRVMQKRQFVSGNNLLILFSS